MIKAVIFDYGGVIKEGRPLSKDIGKISGLSEEELKKTKEERHKIGSKASKGFITDEQFWQEFARLTGKKMPDNCVEQAKKIYRETFVFFAEVIGLIKELKAQGLKTAVLSNIFKFEADVIRENKGYDGFDEVILSYEVGSEKPEAEIYALTVNKLNLRPEECLFIDDKQENLVPAEKLGMKTILFKNPKQAVKDVLSIVSKN